MTELISLNSEFATNRLVLLHGWGADAEDLLPVGKLLTQDLKDRFEIVSLSAPQVHPSGSGRQWYPLYPHEWDQVPNAVLDLERRLNNLCFEKIPLNKTFLLGFSQGGAMALELAKRIKFQGVFALSSYPHPEWQPAKDMQPVFLSHGNNDQVVPKEASKASFDLLSKNGIQSDLYLFEGVFALSSYPHPEWKPLKEMSPIFLFHGNMDEIVPKDASQKSFDILRNNGIKSDLFFFDGGHEIDNDLIDYCRGIIRQQFLS